MRLSQLSFNLFSVLGLTGLLGLVRNHKLLSHMGDGSFTSSRITFDDNNNNDAILNILENLSVSDQHYMLDQMLPNLYSTTHHRIRGNVSFLLEDDDDDDDTSHGTGPGGQEVNFTTNHNPRDVQHRGIVKIGRGHKRKWLRLKRTPSNVTFRVGDEVGYVQDDRLVVDVDHSILSEASLLGGRLCRLLKLMTLRQSLDNTTRGNVRGSPPSFLNVTADCSTLPEDQDMDEGRWIAALYVARMTAAKAGVDFQFKCRRRRSNDRRSAKELRMQKAFVWFGGYQSALIPGTPWPYGGGQEAPTESEICSVNNLDEIPLNRIAQLIRNDARRMAVHLVGSNSKTGRTHHLIPLDADPLVVPQLALDDVTIYLPCDSIVLEGQKKESSTWMHFSEYAKRIPTDVESIGILVPQNDDGNKIGRQRQCNAFTSALQTYLHNQLPSVKVAIRNDDVMPVVYARITMARYSFVPSDNFSGIFPALGSFGQAYLVPSTMTHLKWLDQISDIQDFESFHLVTAERAKVFSSDHHQHTGAIDKKVLDWLTTEPVMQP